MTYLEYLDRLILKSTIMLWLQTRSVKYSKNDAFLDDYEEIRRLINQDLIEQAAELYTMMVLKYD